MKRTIEKTTVAHLAANFFESKDGEIVLDYFRTILINQVLDPPFDALELAYVEGRRSVYADMIKLIETSNKLKAAENGTDERVTNNFNRASDRINPDRNNKSA